MAAQAEEFDTWLTDEIVCPHCGHEWGDSWECLSDGATHGNEECGECGGRFEWTADFSVSYTTSKTGEKEK